MTLRPARPDDAATLGALFADAIRTTGPEHYTAEQVEAWAASAADPAVYGRRILGARVTVAEDDTGAVGFVALGRDGHVAALFVRGDRQRRGVGRALLAALVEQAHADGVDRLHAEASVFSLPLFLSAGFVVVGRDVIERGGVEIERALVERKPSGRGGDRA